MPSRITIRGSRRTQSSRRGSSIEGADEIYENLQRVIDAPTGKKAKAVFMEAGGIVAGDIKGHIGVDPKTRSGELQRSVFVGPGDPDKPDVLVGINGKIASDEKGRPYGPAVEWGHAGPHPAPEHPFFRPALVQAAPRVGQTIKNGLLEVIESAPRR